MWPVVRDGIEFALSLQRPRGEIIWQREADGTPAEYALLTGSSSMHHALRCAIALAEYIGEPQPDWELAAGQLGHAVACHPEAFADKSRFSMDWYYPVLGGPLRGRRGRRAWPRAGTRSWCPASASGASATSPGSPAPRPASWRWRWTRSATTPARWTCSSRSITFGIPAAATGPDGSSPTGKHFPNEQSSWTSAAVILAADALCGGHRRIGDLHRRGPPVGGRLAGGRRRVRVRRAGGKPPARGLGRRRLASPLNQSAWPPRSTSRVA